MVRRPWKMTALLLVLAGGAFPVRAQEPTEPEIGEVVVTATRLRDIGEEASRIPGKVIVITKEEIAKSGARTIQEVLQHQAGVVLYDQIGNAFQSTVDFRGFNAQPNTATSVFVVGVRVNEPDFNDVNFNFIPLEEVERIEIIPGSSAIFGKNALAGVINIITKRGGAKRETSGEVLAGAFGRQRYTFATGGPAGDLYYYLGGTRELEEGFRDESDGRSSRFFVKLGNRPGEATDITLSFTHVNDLLKQAGSLPLSELRKRRETNFTPGDFSDGDLEMVVLNLRQRLPAGLSAALNGFFRHSSTEAFTVGQTSTSRTNTDRDSGGATFQLSHEARLLGRRSLATVGLEYGRNEFDSTSTSAFTGFPPTFQDRATEEDVLGLYAQESFDLTERLTITGGARWDRDHFDFTDRLASSNSGEKTFSRVTPRAGATFKLNKVSGLYFNYSEGFRPPTFFELFAAGPFTANPGLRPVKTRNYEVGARATPFEGVEASAALFLTEVRDEIFFVINDPINLTGRNENVSRTRRQGLELSLKGRHRELVDGFVNYSLTRATFRENFALFGVRGPSFLQDVEKGDELPLVPRHRVSVGVNLHPVKGLTLSLSGLYTSRQFLLNDEANQEQKIGTVLLLNAKATYQVGNFTVFLLANNLLDREDETFGILATNATTGQVEPFLVPVPGVNFSVGVGFRF